MNLPGDLGYYGTVNTKTLNGAFMNTTSQIEMITQGFPNGISPSPSNVQIKDGYTGLYMTLGSEYEVESSGITFQRLNYTANTYYITFFLTSNITVGQAINIPLGSQVVQSFNGQSFDYRTGVYQNQQNQKIVGNLILTFPTNQVPTDITVLIETPTSTYVVSNSSISVIGSTVQVSSISINAGETITVEIYYHVQTVNYASFLFSPISLIAGLNVWDVIGFFLFGMGAVVAQYSYRNRKNFAVKYRWVSIYMVVFLIWFIIAIANAGGII